MGPLAVEVICEDDRWEGVDLAARAAGAARAALAAAGREPEGCELALLATDDARMAALNARFRGKESPTNVLAWPAAAGPSAPGAGVHLGDLALAYETCVREAAERGVGLEEHLCHLVVHGVLHLIGHDHDAPDRAALMQAIEAKALASMGLADPYRG